MLASGRYDMRGSTRSQRSALPVSKKRVVRARQGVSYEEARMKRSYVQSCKQYQQELRHPVDPNTRYPGWQPYRKRLRTLLGPGARPGHPSMKRSGPHLFDKNRVLPLAAAYYCADKFYRLYSDHLWKLNIYVPDQISRCDFSALSEQNRACMSHLWYIMTGLFAGHLIANKISPYADSAKLQTLALSSDAIEDYIEKTLSLPEDFLNAMDESLAAAKKQFDPSKTLSWQYREYMLKYICDALC